MIRLTSSLTPGTDNEVFHLECPRCHTRIVFHMYTPVFCEKCCSPLEDAITIRRYERERLLYHRSASKK